MTRLLPPILIGLVVLPLCTPARSAWADEPKNEGAVKVELHVLTEMNIAAVAIDVGPFSDWARTAIAGIERRFAREKERRDVVVQVTLHKQEPPEVSAAGRPALSKDEISAVLEAVRASDAPRAKAADFSFRIVAKVNGGHPAEDLPLSPPLETPDERRLERFEKAATAERLALLQHWARDEAIPVLAAFASRADAKFEGVRNLGRMLERLDASKPINVEALTERNPDYWRAMVEMTPGEPLVPVVRVALHVANGEIDKARRIAEVASVFDSRQTGPSRLLAEVRALMKVFCGGVESRIREGIRLHDKGERNNALAIYESVLKDYPKSAWAHYERFHTQRELALAGGKSSEQAHADWPKVKAEIHVCDPLYPSAAMATTAPEAYRVFRRMEIRALFKDAANTRKDLIKYADIALDLDEFGFAAMIYWNALVALDAKDYGNRAVIEYFLYSLERLGIKGLKANFKGKHEAEFARIAAERRKLMEESPAFKLIRSDKDKAPKTAK